MPDTDPKPVVTPLPLPMPPQDEKALQLILMKQAAVRQAMTEILNLNRLKVIRLAAKKLRAMGIEVNESELNLS